MSTEPNPIDPESAVKMYLDEREPELADKTLQNIKLHLRHFLKWCEEADVSDTSDLSGRKLHEYRMWRQEQVAQTTLRINLSSLRTFLRWCESIEAVPADLDQKVILPTNSRASEARDTMLEPDQASEVISYLAKFEYASRTHALLKLMWHTGCRKGTIHGLDICDVHPSDQIIETRHRPESDTPLKNGDGGERVIALSDEVTAVLGDYIEHNRIDNRDDHGRDPLFTTCYGRLSKETIKSVVYRVTRPCVYASCPHNRDPEECDATTDSRASRCPSSVSPHPVRRGSITHHLLNEVPETAVSDRCNVSKSVLDKHYDERTEHEKAEQRRQYLDQI